jgi:hypothetical protein
MFDKSKSDIDLLLSLNEQENFEKLRAKKNSNTVFLCCALVLLVVLLAYMMQNNKLNAIVKENKVMQEYMEDPVNIKTYGEQRAMLDKIEEIEAYDYASEEFMKELSSSERVSSHLIELLTDELKKTAGESSRIKSALFKENTVTLECEVGKAEDPKLVAENLTNLKNDAGEPRFANVEYKGFKHVESENKYVFTLNITIWALATSDVAK